MLLHFFLDARPSNRPHSFWILFVKKTKERINIFFFIDFTLLLLFSGVWQRVQLTLAKSVLIRFYIYIYTVYTMFHDCVCKQTVSFVHTRPIHLLLYLPLGLMNNTRIRIMCFSFVAFHPSAAVFSSPRKFNYVLRLAPLPENIFE